MSIFFTSGIETEVDAFTTDFDGKTVNGGNTLLTSTTPADINSGSKGAKVELDGSSTNAYAYTAITENTEHWFRGYVRFDSDFAFTVAYDPISVFEALDGGTAGWYLYIRADSALNTFHWRMYVRVAGTPTVIFTGTTDSVVLNQWYLIEVHWKAGTGADGGAELKIDGSSLVDDFTRDCSLYAIDTFRFGHPGTTTIVSLATGMAFDDMAFDDADWIGAVESGIEFAATVAAVTDTRVGHGS